MREILKRKELYETYIGDKQYISEFKPLIDENINRWSAEIQQPIYRYPPNQGHQSNDIGLACQDWNLRIHLTYFFVTK